MKLLATNQATGTLFRELLDTLAAEGVDTVLLSGFVDMREGYVPPFCWLRACSLQKTPSWRRIWTWGWFTLRAFTTLVRYRRRLAFVVTNPPLVPWVAPLAKRLFGVRYGLLIYDVYPDVLVESGMIRPNGFWHRFMKARSAAALRKAEFVITLGDRMKEAVQRHLTADDDVEIHVIPNWADTDSIRPIPREDNPFACEHGLMDKFVIMYSGAFGATHDLMSIIDAAEALRDVDDIRFVLVGDGIQRATVERSIRERGLDNCQLLPFQPLDTLRYSLSAADCQIVSMDAGVTGTIVPSKTYTNMAAGAAILVIGPEDAEVVQLVRNNECGECIPPRNSQQLANAIRQLHANPSLLARYQVNARQLVEAEYNISVCTQKYKNVLLPYLQR